MEPELQRRVQRYGWDKASKYYEDSWKEQLKPAQDKMMELADLKPGQQVLETACGTGLITLQAAKAVQPKGVVTATDISEKMVVMGKEQLDVEGIDNVHFYRMDAEALEFDDETFDTVICGLGLMYFPDPLKALQENYRLLKPGGKIALAIWGERKNCGWADIFPIVDKRVASDVCPMFFQQGTGNTLENTLTEAGFGEIEIVRMQETIRYPSVEVAVIAAFAGGPVALAYCKFDEQTRREAHEEYLASIEPYRKGNGYEIPGEFVIARGVKS